MTLTPKHTIFIAISNYLTVEINKQLRTELSKNKSITSKKFIEIIEKYFDFKILRDKPIIPEDIWLFNYLMYDNAKNQKLFDVAQECGIKKENIQFTCMESKSVFLKNKGFIFHIDDDDIELMDILDNNRYTGDNCFPVNVEHFEWKETCQDILKKNLAQ